MSRDHTLNTVPHAAFLSLVEFALRDAARDAFVETGFGHGMYSCPKQDKLGRVTVGDEVVRGRKGREQKVHTDLDLCLLCFRHQELIEFLLVFLRKPVDKPQ